MIIYFITTQPQICQIFQHNLQEHQCFIFSDISPVVDLIENKNSRPDLIVADYLINNHSFFNIYDQMNKYKVHIPLIYYNEPIVTAGNRTFHWKLVNKLADIHNKDLDLDKFTDIFKIIEQLVESPQLIPYISLMQKPKPLPKNLLINYLYNDYELENLESILYKTHKLKNMTDGLFFLLELLYKFQERPVSLIELQQEYSANKHKIKLESLKVELSRLKTILKNNPESRFTIIKRAEGIQLVEF